MSIIGKSASSLRKRNTTGDLTIPKTLLFAHEFASASSTIDLTNLVAPVASEFSGWVNPSVAELSAAHLSANKANLTLQYVARAGALIPILSYQIASDMTVNLLNGGGAEAGDILIGVINTYAGNAKAIDGYSIVKTGVLNAGGSIVTSSLPFQYGKYSSEQVGDVLFFLDGQQLFRCESNLIANDGEYIEVAPSAGSLTNSLQLKTAVLVDTPYLIVSNGLVAFAPTEQLLSFIQTLAGQIDIIVPDLAAVTGNPTSRYQAAANMVDTSVFGQRMNALTQETFANAVVGSASQVALGKATHSVLQTAIDSCPTDGKLLILEGTYTENIVINKRIMIEGKGRGSSIAGTVTLQSGCALSTIKNLRIADNVTFNSGADGNFFREIFVASGKTVTDGGTGNSIHYIGE